MIKKATSLLILIAAVASTFCATSPALAKFQDEDGIFADDALDNQDGYLVDEDDGVYLVLASSRSFGYGALRGPQHGTVSRSYGYPLTPTRSRSFGLPLGRVHSRSFGYAPTYSRSFGAGAGYTRYGFYDPESGIHFCYLGGGESQQSQNWRVKVFPCL